MPNYRVMMAYEFKADSLEDAVKVVNGLADLTEKPFKQGWLLEVKELPDA